MREPQTKFGEEELLVLEKAKRFSREISERLALDENVGGRLTFALILKELAQRIGMQLCFSDRHINELCSQLSISIEVDTERITRNPQLLDLLFENLVDLSYRKKWGQFLTPDYIAELLVSWVNDKSPRKILDPSVGTGLFLEHILKSSKVSPIEIWGFDIDPIMLNACQLRLALRGFSNDKLHLIEQDFIRMGAFFSERVDAVVCNPPYLNFHDFDRNTLVKIIEERFGVKLSRLTNIYVLFFLQALSFAKNGCKLAFITPSEFLYTGYGEELKTFLLKNATLDSIVLMNLEFSVFNKALTTAVLTLFRKGTPRSRHKVRFIRIHAWPGMEKLLEAVNDGVQDPEKYRLKEVYQDELNPNDKWLEHFIDVKNGHVLDKLVPLSQLADIDRGIATGFNKYFVLSRSVLRDWKIEDKFVVPVVSVASYIPGYDFTIDDWNLLAGNNEKTYLLYIFREPSRNLQEYIKYGEQEKLGVDKRYLTRHRNPWYSMERKEPAKILATVFHRKRMRFILNLANVRNLAAFHCVNPKFNDITLIKALLAYLNSDFCREVQTIKRREYGGGLHKFEPRDIENIPTLDVTCLSKQKAERLASFFDSLCSAFRNGKTENGIRSELDATLQGIISELP